MKSVTIILKQLNQLRIEPTSIRISRICTMLLFVYFLEIYFSSIYKKVINDQFIIIRENHVNKEEIPVPDMIFYSGHPFVMYCHFINSEGDHDCSDSLLQADGTDYRICFTNKYNLTYKDPKDVIKIYIHYTNFNATHNPPTMLFSATDSENDSVCGMDMKNIYFMVKQQVTIIKLTRHLKRKIIDNFLGRVGITNNYNKEHHITSKVSGIEKLDKLPDELPSDSYVSGVFLHVHDFDVNVETEQRTQTFLSNLGSLGGILGIFGYIFAFLFGVNRMKPWGFVHRRCRGRMRYKLEDTFPVIPLIGGFERSLPSSSSQEISREEHITLQNRVNALEIFLREYVANVDYLETLRGHNPVAEEDDHELGSISI